MAAVSTWVRDTDNMIFRETKHFLPFANKPYIVNFILHASLFAVGLIQAGGCAHSKSREPSTTGEQLKQVSQQRLEYTSVDYTSLADFDFDRERNTLSDIPSAVRQLDGRKVRITGTMASLEEDLDVLTDKFALLPRDFQHDHPRVPQFILIYATDRSGKFRIATDLFEIGGTFHVGLLKYEGEVYSLFSMDADYCKKVGD